VDASWTAMHFVNNTQVSSLHTTIVILHLIIMMCIVKFEVLLLGVSQIDNCIFKLLKVESDN